MLLWLDAAGGGGAERPPGARLPAPGQLGAPRPRTQLRGVGPPAAGATSIVELETKVREDFTITENGRSVLIVKALAGAFDQEKALVRYYKPSCGTSFQAQTANRTPQLGCQLKLE